MKRWIFLLILLLLPGQVLAQLQVVATTESMGMLVRTVGGDRVQVTVLAPADRDAHELVARPSMMAALRRADLLLAVGAGLEEGWLPAAVRGAGNGHIVPGRPGYMEATATVSLLGTHVPADRSLGHVHPEGNPHINLDPQRMAAAARALAERLAELSGEDPDGFLARAAAFEKEVQTRLPGWRTAVRDAPGVLAYHEDVNYLVDWLGVPLHGYVEPLPGVPPAASHLRGLVERLRGKRGVVVHADYQPVRGPRFMGEALGWPVHGLPMEPPAGGDAQAYFRLIDLWVDALSDPSLSR